MKPGATLDLYTHWQTCCITPAIVYNRAVCSNPACRTPHGWSLEFSFLWWSLCLEVVIDYSHL